MLKREIHMLENKLKAIGNKREVVFRERKLLMDRIDTITTSIGQEVRDDSILTQSHNFCIKIHFIRLRPERNCARI